MQSSKQHNPPEAAQPPGGAFVQHRHHSHPGDTLEDAHTVVLEGDVEITVGEDEPAKHAVEAEISKIEEQDAGRPIKEYLDKWRGGIDTRVPVPSVRGMAVSWLGAFIGILVVSVTDHFLWRDHGFRLLVASFGASAVLLYGVPESKLSQPRNLIGGQVVSAIVGVCVRLALDKVQWLANALGMSLALLAMQLTQTTHPPGGATALIACSMAQLPPWSGFQLVVAVTLGAVELMVVALLITNLHKDRAYPTFWW